MQMKTLRLRCWGFVSACLYFWYPWFGSHFMVCLGFTGWPYGLFTGLSTAIMMIPRNPQGENANDLDTINKNTK